MARITALLTIATLTCGLLPAPASAQAPLRKIGEMELQLAGLSAVLDPVNPVVPKNTPAGVQVVVHAGGRQLTAAEVEGLVGGVFFLEAELNGPGLPRTITVPDPKSSDPLPADPLILPLPGLSVAGDYELSNVRIVSGGRAVMGVLPELATLKVIDQVLVTKLVTRPLTLDELKEKGIEITSRDYTGFEFSLALRLESEVVQLDFPVVFDRQGVVVPQPIENRVTDPTRKVERPEVPKPPAMIVPVMLLPEGEFDTGPDVALTLPNGEPVRIPSVLVIPGNVGYLKQFFSAMVYVANGTPIGSRLFVRDIEGKIQLPPGDDRSPGNADDPLYLAKRIGEDTPPFERPVLGVGPDEQPGTEDDVSVFAPGEQGQAEWVLVGNGEGFHKIDIALGATLEGLPTGPVRVKGAASGGVLVRNASFDVTFTVPSVVRDGESFRAAITLNNIGKGNGQDVHIQLDVARMSGLELIGEPEQSVPLIAAGEAHTFEYEFKSLRTGKVVSTYLRFDTPNEAGDVEVTGSVNFTIGVTDEGVPLSPDTLVLPASVNLLPGSVTYAAMRVLGQAWSIANAPRNTLPAHVTRITRAQVEEKALALAEAGLRVTLREEAQREAALQGALRDLALDFWGGEPVDPGFDRLLRQSDAGRAFVAALGAALLDASDAAGGPAAFEHALAEVAASGPDFLSLSVEGQVDVRLTDSLGRATAFERSTGGGASALPSAVLLPLGPPDTAPLVGLVTEPVATGYRLDVSGPALITLTAPQSGGFVRGTVNADGPAVLAIDLARPEPWVLQQDLDGDGEFEASRAVSLEALEPQGPELLAALVIGSETLPRAGDFGLNAVLVFDRPVDAARASDTSAYAIPKNRVVFARPQLSGRLVFATLDQPEGPNVPTEIATTGITDRRGFARDALRPLGSRLRRGGAWLSGQVRESDGTPVDQGSVVYSNVTSEACAIGGRPGPLARAPLGTDGSYELRYVYQGACGFEVAAADTSNVQLRKLAARVRRPGERMFLDIVLLGSGAVEGYVRDLAGQPVAGAAVAVTSETDDKRGAGTVSDAAGYYRVEGLPVGLVSVKAGRGTGLGSATGRIERASTAARVDVTLDSGAVTVSGHFHQVRGPDKEPMASALMAYSTAGGVAGYVFTDDAGLYRFEGMPVGAFTITGSGYGPFGAASASAQGSATAGQTLENVELVHVAKSEAVLGTIHGVVTLPGGAPAKGVIVAQDVSTAFIVNATGTDAEGNFELGGLPTGVNVSIGAITSDRRRKGHAWAFIDPVTREQDGVVIVLSAISKATFTVKGPNDLPIPNQEVALLGVGGFAGLCRNPCGCRTGTTDPFGQVTFVDLPLGTYTAQAVRREGGFTEAATGTAVVDREGETGFGVIRLLGAGTVTGTVSLDSPNATFTGGSVSLSSRSFVNDGLFTCGMVMKESHKAQVNPGTSTYEFKGVAVGTVSVSGKSDLGVATNKGNLAKAGDTLTLDLVYRDTIAGDLTGTVFLPSGTPAGQGVEVTVNGRMPDVTVFTDANSRFAFAPVLPEGNYSITARDPLTGGVVRESIYLRVGQDLQHDLRLKGKGTVRVKVEDALGQAVDRAFVTLKETQFPQRRHDRSIEPTLLGVATFEGVFEGPFSVEVNDLNGRGGRGSGAVPAPDSAVDVTVRLNPTGNVKGTFLMPDGETPIPYALVTLYVNGRAVGQTTTPGTGELLGQFFFDFVPAGPVRVEAEDPLTLRTGFAVGTLEAGVLEALDLAVIAKGLGKVQGTVLARVAGGGEEARPGASVKIQAGSYKGNSLADAVGHYEFAGVPEGPLTVTASVGALALTGSASGAVSQDGETVPLDVYLRDSGRVSGQVLRSDAETEAPPSKVVLQTSGIGGGRHETYTREGGVFSFEQVATGRATLTAEVLGDLDRGRGAVDVVVGDNDGAKVVLNGVGSLLVKARDSKGDPIAGDVWLSGTGAFPWQEFVRVPASGEARLAKVLAGPVTAKLRAKPGEATLWGTATGEVAPDQEREVVVMLAESGTVTGRVLRPGSLVAAYGADVTLLLSGGAGQVKVQADESGAFVATGIPLVAFDLRASDPVSSGLAMLRELQIPANGATLALGDIVLDETAPLITILSPVEGSTRPGFAGELAFELSDEGAGVDLATLVVRWPLGLPTYRNDFTITGNQASAPFDPNRLTAGLNVIRISIKDLAGRVGEAEVAFRVVGGTIRGNVSLPGGAGPALGRAVTIYGASVVTDDQGEFVFEGLRSQNYTVRVDDAATGLWDQKTVHLDDGGEEHVSLQLPAFMRLTGTVHRGEDPVAGIRVSTSIPGVLWRQYVTGADGFYDLGALPLGTYTVDARNGNRLRGRVEDVVLATPEGLRDLPIPLVAVGTVHGVVTAPGGEPAKKATVTVLSLADPWGGHFTTSTNETGAYAIDDVPEGGFTISASKGGDQANETGAVPAGGGPVKKDLELQPSAVTLPKTLSDAGGAGWMVRKNGAVITSGTRRVFMTEAATPRLTLVRDGVPTVFAGSCPATGTCTAASEESEREIVLTAADLAGLAVARKIYVPVDGYFARVLDMVRNDGPDPVTVDLLEESEVWSTSVRATSSGDLAVQPADRWLTLDDSDSTDIHDLSFPTNSFAPTAFVGWGDGGTGPDVVSVSYQSAIQRTRVSQRWSNVTLAPGQTVGVLQFVAIQSNRDRAKASAERLVQLPPEAIAGLELDEAAAILNFAVPGDLASIVDPLPPNDGIVTGAVLGGDLETPISPAQLRLRSQSPYFGKPLLANAGLTGTFSFQGRPDQGSVIPRGHPFDVRATRSGGFGSFTATTTGHFAPEAGGPASSASVTLAFADTGVVKGFVRRSDDSAVLSSYVTLRVGSLYESKYVDSLGGFVFAPVAAGSATLTASHPLGGYSFTTPTFPVPGPCSDTPEGRRCDRVERDVVFPAFGTVEVHVTTAGGPAYANVQLLAEGFSRQHLTDPATGLYTFADVPPGAYTVVARGQGVPGIAATHVTVAADALAPVFLELGTATRLTGRVIGGALRPVLYQPVRLVGASGGPIASTYADVNGDFVLDNLPKGSFLLRAEYLATESGEPRRSRFDVPLVLAADDETADALIPVGIAAPGEAHRFELVAPAGRPLAFAASGLAYGSPALASFDLFVFGPDGALVAASASSGGPVKVDVASSEAGRYVVAIRSAAAAAGMYRVSSPTLDEVHVFRPLAGGLVELQVRRGPAPLAGQAVTIESERADLPPAERLRSGTTGVGGLFRAAFPDGPIVGRTFDAASGDPYEVRGTLATGQTLSLTITLPALPSTVRGVVVNGDGLAALPGASVTLTGQLSAPRYASADASGAFVFEDVPPDEYTLRADYGSKHYEESLTTTGGEYVRELRVPIPVVRGQVQEPSDGSGVAAARVRLCFWAGCYDTTADANGFYAFIAPSGLAPAYVSASFPEAQSISSGWISIPWYTGFTGTVLQNVVMPETARLWGVVRDAGRAAADHAPVSAYADGANQWLLNRVETDEDGVYRMRVLQAGPVRVYAERWWGGGTPGQRRGTLVLGEELKLDIELAATGSLEVRIVDDQDDMQCGNALLQSIEQPGANGGVWSRHLNLCLEGPTTEWVEAPVGAYRVYVVDSDAPGAVEGVLAEGDFHEIALREGSHVRLPRALPGGQALFLGDMACPPPCSGYAFTEVPGAEAYPPVASPEADGRSLRGLQVASAGVRVRRTQYAPATGAFGRTLTLVTNPGADAVALPLDTVLHLDSPPGDVVTPGGGTVDPSQPWALVRHASGIQGLVVGGALAPNTFAVFNEPGEIPGIETHHTLTVPAGQSVALLTYALVAAGSDTAALEARAAALATLAEPGAVLGLTNEERAAIVNFAGVPPAGDVRVSVAFAGDLVAGARVGAVDAAGNLVAQATTDSHGAAFFAGLPTGSYSIVAVGEYERPGRTVVDVTAGTAAADTIDADVVLLTDDELGGVEVQVAWTGSGEPAAGVSIELDAVGWSPLWRPAVETDAAGNAFFGPVPPGALVVRVLPSSLGVESATTVVAGASTPVALAVAPYATLEGQVTAGDGATAVADAPVVAIDAASGDVLGSSRTNEDGSYRIAGVRPGAAGLFVRAASPHDAAVTVDSPVMVPDLGDSWWVEPLQLPVGVITGYVYEPWFNPDNESNDWVRVRNPVVVARDSAGHAILGAWTSEAGAFRIVGVAGGIVILTAQLPNGEREQHVFYLDPAEAVWDEFYLGSFGY